MNKKLMLINFQHEEKIITSGVDIPVDRTYRKIDYARKAQPSRHLDEIRDHSVYKPFKHFLVQLLLSEIVYYF